MRCCYAFPILSNWSFHSVENNLICQVLWWGGLVFLWFFSIVSVCTSVRVGVMILSHPISFPTCFSILDRTCSLFQIFSRAEKDMILYSMPNTTDIYHSNVPQVVPKWCHDESEARVEDDASCEGIDPAMNLSCDVTKSWKTMELSFFINAICDGLI